MECTGDEVRKETRSGERAPPRLGEVREHAARREERLERIRSEKGREER